MQLTTSARHTLLSWGWVEALIDNGSQELYISHAPDADLDASFPAFCHDKQELILVSGWQIASYERVAA